MNDPKFSNPTQNIMKKKAFNHIKLSVVSVGEQKKNRSLFTIRN